MKKISKLLSAILITAILLTLAMPTVLATDFPFTDVDPTAVSADAILWAQQNGIVTGANGLFSPGAPMTRAQYALILWRYEGQPAPTATGQFTDVDASGVAATAIEWAASEGIVTGANGLFNPTGNMTRAQMVLMMYRYSDLRGFDTSSNANALDLFTDSTQINIVAMEAMRWAVTHGLVTGGNNLLNPNDSVTRAQVVLILYRFVNKFEEAEQESEPGDQVEPEQDEETELPIDEGEVIFEEHGIRIKYLGTERRTTPNRTHFMLYIENDTDYRITVQIRNYKINGIRSSFSAFSPQIQSGNSTTASITAYDWDLANLGIEEIEEIEFNLYFLGASALFGGVGGHTVPTPIILTP